MRVGDTFFGFLSRGATAPWLPEAYAQNQVVIEAAAAATGRFVAGGVHVAYDGVVGPWFVDQLAATVPDLRRSSSGAKHERRCRRTSQP